MRTLSEYEVVKILNKVEANYIKNMKNSKGDIKRYNVNMVYAVREIRNIINKYLDKKYES